MARIIDFFQNNKVKVVKLNHCLSMTGETQFDGFIKLSKDGNQVEITKKIPQIKMFIKSADTNFIHNEQVRAKK